jgi:hypothetical protein
MGFSSSEITKAISLANESLKTAFCFLHKNTGVAG